MDMSDADRMKAMQGRIAVLIQQRDQARKDLKIMREALYEIHGILDTAGFCPDEHYG